MARATDTQNYNNFSNGLVTEATDLSYPKNSAVDLDNVDLHLDGSVRRRLGLDADDSQVFNFASEIGQTFSMATGMWVWESPGSDSNLVFLVVQGGLRLSIYDITNKPVVEKTGFAFPDELASGDADNERFSISVGNGVLYIVHPHMYPKRITYDPVGNTFTLEELSAFPNDYPQYIAVRDFKGLPDPRKITERVPGGAGTESIVDVVVAQYGRAPIYNVINQGFYSLAQIESLADERQYFPALSDVIDPDNEQFAISLGPVYAPMGNIMIDFISGSRQNIIYDSKLKYKGNNKVDYPQEDLQIPTSFNGPVTRGFSTSAFFAGRLWLSGADSPIFPNAVLFSKLIEKPEDAAFFAQVANPTDNHPQSPLGPDIVDTDGGVIMINDAGRILKLEPYADGILAFATRGVWFIRGGETGFSATGYSVDKVSDFGCVGAESVVSVGNSVLYWGESGIINISSGSSSTTFGGVSSESLTDNRIKSFYNKISKSGKRDVWGVYDVKGSRIMWLYRDELSHTDGVDDFSYTDALILDLRTGAFYKYTLPSITDTDTTYTTMAAFNAPENSELIQDSNETSLKFFLASLFRLFDDRISMSIGSFHDTTFKDFSTFYGTPLDYQSYIEAFEETLGDWQRYKQATYVQSFFNRTEKEILSVNPLTFDRPSKCLLYGKWDWHSSPAGNRWSNPQQAYRFRKPITSPVVGPFDNGEAVVYTKLKVRGKGKSLSLRFESESGADFQLLGYTVQFTGNAI